ncbi:MAG: TlpA family protein disulfide reductase [Pirellulales bacterium]|nr:TlpA family protein disulfide reductase [Pirellulales bacterium]
MNPRAAALIGLLLCALTAPVAGNPSDATPSLDAVKWADGPVSFQALRGKTVVVLVYATWCPKCNKWSGELFAQLIKAIADKPVVVLAINADKSPHKIKEYLTQRGFFAPNVIHGYDPSMPGRLGFQSNLFLYVQYRPDGALGGRGQAGSYIAGSDPKQFVLPAKLAADNDLGSFSLLKPEMSDALKQAIWPLEIGRLPDASSVAAGQRLSREDRKEFDAALEKHLGEKLRCVAELAKGTPIEQFEAYDEANRIAALFKNTEQGKEARRLAAELGKDKDFRRELAAKRAYDRAMKSAAAKPNLGERIVKAFIKRFKGTYYAELAEKELEGERQKDK